MIPNNGTFMFRPARELEVADVKDSRQQLAYLSDQSRGQAHSLEGLLELFELLIVG